MKKLIALALVLVTMLSLASCGGYDLLDLRSMLKENGFEVSIEDNFLTLEENYEELADEGFDVPVALLTAKSEDDSGEYIRIIMFNSSSEASDFEEWYLENLKESFEERAEKEDMDIKEYLKENYDVKTWDDYIDEIYALTNGQDGNCFYTASNAYIVEIVFG